MIRPPPISPLFPYTTLFRSISYLLFRAVPGQLPLTERIPLVHAADVAGGGGAAPGERQGLAQPAGLAPAEDRKSTRLNSSHANISYVVFCLKKKNKILYTRV